MKPKNRVMCPDCGRQKMVFETKEKAMNFIKFNGDEISNGKKLRWYFCPACCGYHITSKPYKKSYDGRTEKLIEAYKRQKKAMDDLEKSQIKFQRETALVNKIYKQFMKDRTHTTIDNFVSWKYPSFDEEEKNKILKRLKHRLENYAQENWYNLSKEEKSAIIEAVAMRVIRLNITDSSVMELIIKNECKDRQIPLGCYGTIKEKCMIIRNEMG